MCLSKLTFFSFREKKTLHILKRFLLENSETRLFFSNIYIVTNVIFSLDVSACLC